MGGGPLLVAKNGVGPPDVLPLPGPGHPEVAEPELSLPCDEPVETLPHPVPFLGEKEDLPEGPALHLLLGVAREGLAGMVEPHDPPVPFQNYHEGIENVKGRADEVSFAAELLVQSPVLGDVAPHRENPDRVPLLVPDGLVGPPDPDPPAFLRDVLVLVALVLLGVGEEPRDHLLEVPSRALCRGHDGPDDIFPEDLRPGEAEEPLGVLVEEGDPAGEVHLENDGVCLLHQLPVLLLRLPEGLLGEADRGFVREDHRGSLAPVLEEDGDDLCPEVALASPGDLETGIGALLLEGSEEGPDHVLDPRFGNGEVGEVLPDHIVPPEGEEGQEGIVHLEHPAVAVEDHHHLRGMGEELREGYALGQGEDLGHAEASHLHLARGMEDIEVPPHRVLGPPEGPGELGDGHPPGLVPEEPLDHAEVLEILDRLQGVSPAVRCMIIVYNTYVSYINEILICTSRLPIRDT